MEGLDLVLWWFRQFRLGSWELGVCWRLILYVSSRLWFPWAKRETRGWIRDIGNWKRMGFWEILQGPFGMDPRGLSWIKRDLCLTTRWGRQGMVLDFQSQLYDRRAERAAEWLNPGASARRRFYKRISAQVENLRKKCHSWMNRVIIKLSTHVFDHGWLWMRKGWWEDG